MVNGTSYAFSKSKISILSNAFLNGYMRMQRNGIVDFGIVGRLIAARNFTNQIQNIRFLCKELIQVDARNNNKYHEILSNIDDSRKVNFLFGANYFYNSLFLSQQNSLFYSSVKMTSQKNVGIESGKFENIYGGYLPLGCNIIMRTGFEYYNIYPLWDWTKIPGVTAEENNFVLNDNGAQYTGDNSFAIGCSDGQNGCAAMDVSYKKLQARKSWFFFDSLIIALGNGINDLSNIRVTSSLNQCWNFSTPILNGVEKRS